MVLERPLTTQDLAHDRDVLTRLGERLAVRLAVPPLDDLWPAQTEPEQQPATRQQVESGSRHRGVGGRARRHLQDRGTEPDRRRVRTHPRERHDRVRAVGLGRPHGMEAERLGALHDRDRVGGSRVPVSEVEAETHGRTLSDTGQT